MGNLLSEEVIAYFIFLIEFSLLICVSLHEILFSQVNRLSLIGFSWEKRLSFFYSLLKILKCLLIRINKQLVIQSKFEIHSRYNPQIECEIPMIASHPIEDIDQLYPHFSYLNSPYHLLKLDLNRIDNLMLVENSFEKTFSVFLE